MRDIELKRIRGAYLSSLSSDLLIFIPSNALLQANYLVLSVDVSNCDATRRSLVHLASAEDVNLSALVAFSLRARAPVSFLQIHSNSTAKFQRCRTESARSKTL